MGKTPSTNGAEAAGLPPLSLTLVSERPSEDDPRVIVYETTMSLEQLRGRFHDDVAIADRWCRHERRKPQAFGAGEGDAWRLWVRFGPRGHGQSVLELKVGDEVVRRHVITHPSEDIRMAFQVLMSARFMPMIAQAISLMARSRRLIRCRRRRITRRRDGEVPIRSSMMGRKG